MLKALARLRLRPMRRESGSGVGWLLRVTTSSARVASLAKACRQLPRGHGLFLFTDIASVNAHRNLLTLPFQTGHIGETTTLLA